VWSIALNEIHQIAALVPNAAARTTHNWIVHGRWAPALTSRATDSPSTINTSVSNRSGKCKILSGAARAARTISHGVTISARIAAPHSAYLGTPAIANDPTQQQRLTRPTSACRPYS
jgi:hypothetical protein